MIQLEVLPAARFPDPSASGGRRESAQQDSSLTLLL
eukprot:CAMPEP_0194536860 /NCGR_PEP_ID=MMETSP0253-20130528/75919_1 /TAXON_ID=2966 /ORGANISM="Noctiluca scintillans" /LENGTH=35 /DNA_ID= /DNA_START= /DNA_END= /DNA_ORIENTATION=